MNDLIIIAENLTKTFGDFTAVNNISFAVKTGEIFAFLGPNGAGKTTTIKMLTTLLSPTSGFVEVDGHSSVKQQDEVRHSFGIVFQDPSLDDELTAFENMEFHGVLYSVPKDLRQKRIKEMFDLVDLWDRRDELVKNYSGGMKRRLEIARGLLHHPKILFLDEPTLGLDPQTRNHIWSYLKELNKNEKLTIFFTTHYMGEVEKTANTVAIIDQGKIIVAASPEKIIADNGVATLEEAFLKLTGNVIRDESVSGVDRLRSHRKMWRR
ncbi:MAG: ATP-binding cassette domain-containing protein [Patescibacteria group bacterium]|nr:ATP-binding cassette domain-containing protein [Patescibacteria group bacterium]